MKKVSLAEETISQEELFALSDWVKQGSRLTKGPLCLEFERQFAEWQGSRYAVFVNSGSSANLLLAYTLKEGGFLKNNKVVAPAVSWCTTVTPFIQFGFDVRLCDCDKHNLGLDIKHFEELCEKEKPAIAILVHVLGHANSMKEIQAICDKHEVLLLEDTCEALATTYAGKKCGSLGLAGTFSFYYGHHISTIEGGMIVTDDQNLYNLMISIRSHGWARDVEKPYHDAWTAEYDIDEISDLYTFYYPGLNLRSTDLNAFLGVSQLKHIDGYALARQKNYFHYAGNLKDYWVQTSDSEFLSNFAYGVLVENRLETYKHLTSNNIECRPLICGNLGLHPFWINKYGARSLPMADIVHHNGLYLPNHAKLSEEQIDFVCEKFKEAAQPFAF